MLYEVVDPDHRGERGPMFDTAVVATVNAGSDCEVWQLADYDEQTRLLRVWPEPDAPQVAALAERRAEKQTAEYVGQAEREAAAILASSLTRTQAEIHDALTLAWLKGFMAGYGNVVERLDEIIAAYESKVRP